MMNRSLADTQEDFEATLEEYVERIRLLERREEEGERSKAQRNNNKLAKQMAVGWVLPGFMCIIHSAGPYLQF